MGGVHSAECRENMRKVSLETMGHGEEGMGEGSTRGGGGGLLSREAVKPL